MQNKTRYVILFAIIPVIDETSFISLIVSIFLKSTDTLSIDSQ